MPRVMRRTPATEEAATYGYGDFLKEIIQRKLASDAAQSDRMLAGTMTKEDMLDIGLAGVGAGTKIARGVGKGKFPFNLKTTDVPLWNAILKKPAYHKEAKGIERSIDFMSPEKYFEKVERKLGIERETGKPHKDWADPEIVKKYAKEMEEGAKFPMPGLEYGNKAYFGQEGRHRMLAAEMLGIDRVPVLVMRSLEKALEKKKWKMPITRPHLASTVPKEAAAIVEKYKSQGLTYDAFVNQIPDKPQFAYHQWTFRGEGPLRGATVTTKGTSLDEFEKMVADRIKKFSQD